MNVSRFYAYLRVRGGHTRVVRCLSIRNRNIQYTCHLLSFQWTVHNNANRLTVFCTCSSHQTVDYNHCIVYPVAMGTVPEFRKRDSFFFFFLLIAILKYLYNIFHGGTRNNSTLLIDTTFGRSNRPKRLNNTRLYYQMNFNKIRYAFHGLKSVLRRPD